MATEAPGPGRAVKLSRVIHGSGEEVAAVLEKVEEFPEWHPLAKGLKGGAEWARDKGSRADWQVRVPAIHGRQKDATETEVTAEAEVWEHGRAYQWKSTEKATGLTWNARFEIEPSKEDQTTVTMTVTLDLPEDVNRLANPAELQRFMHGNITSVLENLDRRVQGARSNAGRG
jgi:hypothetical protein